MAEDQPVTGYEGQTTSAMVELESVGFSPISPVSSHHDQTRSILDWERHRETITSLYIDQNVTLADLQRIMGARFGFRAT
jgi:Clr5 domain